MDKIKKQILQGFLKTIEIISDKEHQERVWIRGEGPECYDFEEAACDFFHEGDAILDKYQDFEITENQYQLLLQFRNAFDACDRGPSPFTPEVIESVEWKNIMQMGKEVLIAFNYPEISQ